VRDQFEFDEVRASALVAEAEKSGVDSAEVLLEIEAICEPGQGRGLYTG
jgi:hypothetical protein